jgi:hypothetical protein
MNPTNCQLPPGEKTSTVFVTRQPDERVVFSDKPPVETWQPLPDTEKIYERQIADMDKWIGEVIGNGNHTEADKVQILAAQLMTWAGCYVHGANYQALLYRLNSRPSRPH